MGDDYPVYGPQVKRPLRVRVLQLASVILAVAGLILLYFYSIHRDIPVVKVAEINPAMNFAYVRITGEVIRDAYVFKSGGVVFTLNDGSGDIAVMGGRAQAEALQRAGRLPYVGDRVEVAGSLSVSADQEIKLRMQSADQMILQRKRSDTSSAIMLNPVPLAEVSAAQKDERISIVGTLRNIQIPGPGSKAPYVLTLERDGAELEVVFWDKVFQKLEKTLPMPGKIISASGKVDVYKGKVQLKVWDDADLHEVPEAQMPIKASIADIRAEQEGAVFTVTGTLGEPRSIPGGVCYPIRDETGDMAVLFWDKKVSGEERDALEEGVRLRVTAPLVAYKGTLELIPENIGAFSVEMNE
ncbi:OB-fold nucleic acid binding domain-containing protein [Tichowtungia aerotolerans]|uniref:OB domain-containing protein n=1 Tax=Tichowtungia aerotolerans TaxID=2697043 RepID=A0A6P1M272_9BACT|nr:OB-fold nucleic acid binding domain-containing protein [Tichowtungia aerotolerans]QHI67927.1 hypothetical protein GT409_00185 [Tichowtungia aerotolerans]